MDVLLPPGWAPPIGYANGIAVTPGRLVFVAGQVGWDANQRFASEELAPPFDQALANVIAVVAAAGGRPEHICRITAYCCDKPAYLAARPELGRIWRARMGRHFVACIEALRRRDSSATIEVLTPDFRHKPGAIESQ